MTRPNLRQIVRSVRLGWPPWLPPLRVPTIRDVRAALRRHPGLKLVSILLATFLWYSVNVLERDAERIVEVPISIRKLSPELIVTTPPVKPVAVVLRGPGPILDGVDEGKTRLTLNLSQAITGESRLELNAAMLSPELPRRLKVVRMQPAFVKLRVERVAHRRLPVRIELAGSPMLGYTVAESQVTPDHVDVTGPASRVDELKEIVTETIDLRALEQSVEQDVLLGWAGEFVTIVPDHVGVQVTLEQVRVSRDFKRVTVRAVGGQGVHVNPATIDLTVQGPQQVLHNFKIPEDAVRVDASDLGAGTHRVVPEVMLPATLQVVGRRPEYVEVLIPGPGGGE